MVIPKHNGLIDELEDTTAAASIGAVAPTGRTGDTVQEILDDISSFDKIESGGTTFTADGFDTFKINAGSNVTITALESPDKGIQISASGGGSSTGDMLMTDYDSLGTVKSAGGIPSYVTGQIGALDGVITGSAGAGKTLTAFSQTDGKVTATFDNISITKSQVSDFPTLATVATSGSYNDLSSKPTIPDELADLTSDADHRTVSDTEKTAWNGKSTVAWSQSLTTGQKIATVTINGTPTDVYAPTGGSPGTGPVTSVNSQTGDVVLDVDDINDVVIASAADGDVLAYDLANTKWKNKALSIPTVTDTYSGTSSNAMSGKAVKQALETLDVTDSAVSGKYVSAVSETDGKITVTRADLPTIPTITDTYSGTSSDGMSGKAVKSAIDALDVTDSAVSGKYVSAVSETDGKITVTRANLPTVSIAGDGTASSTVTHQQQVTINGGTPTDIDGTVYMETTATTSASSTTTVQFQNAAITANSVIDYYCSQWNLVPDNIACASGECVVTLPTVTTAPTVTVRIYIR